MTPEQLQQGLKLRERINGLEKALACFESTAPKPVITVRFTDDEGRKSVFDLTEEANALVVKAAKVALVRQIEELEQQFTKL
jgi:hypothetical protein